MERIPDFKYSIGRYSITVKDDSVELTGNVDDMKSGIKDIFMDGVKETKYEALLYFKAMECLHLYTKLTILKDDDNNKL